IVEPEAEIEADSAHFLIEPPAIEQPAAAAPAPVAVEEPEAVAAIAPAGPVRVEETGRRSRGLLYAAIVVLLVIAVVTYFVLNRRREAAPSPEVPPPTGSTATPSAAGAVAPTGALPGP